MAYGGDARTWIQHVGKRVLASKRFDTHPTEIVVVEIAPSGFWMKVRFLSGHETWEAVNEWNFGEVLADR